MNMLTFSATLIATDALSPLKLHRLPILEDGWRIHIDVLPQQANSSLSLTFTKDDDSVVMKVGNTREVQTVTFPNTMYGNHLYMTLIRSGIISKVISTGEVIRPAAPPHVPNMRVVRHPSPARPAIHEEELAVA